MAVIVYIADLLLSRFHIGFELERLDTRALADLLGYIDLTVDHFGDLVDLIPDTVFRSITETSSAELRKSPRPTVTSCSVTLQPDDFRIFLAQFAQRVAAVEDELGCTRGWPCNHRPCDW